MNQQPGVLWLFAGTSEIVKMEGDRTNLRCLCLPPSHNPAILQSSAGGILTTKYTQLFYQIVFNGCSLALRKSQTQTVGMITLLATWKVPPLTVRFHSTTSLLNLSPGPGPELDGGWYLGPEYLCCYPLHQRPVLIWLPHSTGPRTLPALPCTHPIHGHKFVNTTHWDDLRCVCSRTQTNVHRVMCWLYSVPSSRLAPSIIQGVLIQSCQPNIDTWLLVWHFKSVGQTIV